MRSREVVQCTMSCWLCVSVCACVHTILYILFWYFPTVCRFCHILLFAGKYCDEDIDECALSPLCLNGGTCMNNVGSYFCVCVNGWAGKHCALNEDDCQNMPCYNGGTCHDRVGYFECECPVGKTGMSEALSFFLLYPKYFNCKVMSLLTPEALYLKCFHCLHLPLYVSVVLCLSGVAPVYIWITCIRVSALVYM